MNSIEKQYFLALTADREESADMLEKPSMRGIKNSVVEKYSDQAHFIYELLQNADDAGATGARFILEKNQLIFAHNGTRHFSVSDPSREDQDSKIGALGDINAITSIANSNKTEASIGKFGVGFKAVFQYTSTPHIYDQNYRFRIDRFIVPSLLETDHDERNDGETLFVFPFDHPDRDATEAYDDISNKLKNLTYPLLFLSELKTISFEVDGRTGSYKKLVEDVHSCGSITEEQVCLKRNDGIELFEESLWLFSRQEKHQFKYSVGFFTDKSGQLKPVKEPAFCFFPTKEVTGLNFIVHAPFLLTDSREGVRAGVVHNERMVELLADLAADSLCLLRDIGVRESVRLIDDNIINIIPYDKESFQEQDNKRKISFEPFYHKIREKFLRERLIPSSNDYIETKNAYWADIPQLAQLFTNDQLAEICENSHAQWAFTSMGRYEIQRNNKALFSYLDSLVRTDLNEDSIISGRLREFYFNQKLNQRIPLENIKGITGDFIEKQSIDWLHMFYRWLSETKHRTNAILKKPIFIDLDKRAVAAFDEKMQPILFLPVEGISGYETIHPSLMDDPETKQFIEQVGICEPSLKDRIYNIILPQYREGGAIDVRTHFKMFLDYYCECTRDEADTLINLIKEYKFLMFQLQDSPKLYRDAADDLYIPTPELKRFLKSKKDVRFLALEEYSKLIEPSKEKKMLTFFSDLGVAKFFKLVTVEIDPDTSGRVDLPMPYSTRGRTYEEVIIEGCKELIDDIERNEDKDKSVFLWDCLIQMIQTWCNTWENKSLSSLLSGKCNYFYRHRRIDYFLSSDVNALRKSKWIVDSDGRFVAPQDLIRTELSDRYNISTDVAEELIEFLSIQELPEEDDDSNLTDTQREKIEFADKIRELGIDESDLEDFKEFLMQKKSAKKNEAIGKERTTETQEKLLDDVLEDEAIVSEKKRVVKDIVERTVSKDKANAVRDSLPEEEEVDGDELIPQTIDYSKRIERAKQKSATEIDRIAKFEQLQTKAVASEKYSYTWFNTLLEMESLNSGDTSMGNREVSISFAKVEREPGTKRTLILKHPSRHIPHFMEDLADIPMIFHMGDGTRTVILEAANVKSYTLRVKLKSGSDIEGIDLDTVKEVTIDAKSPAFLLEELRKQFALLKYDDSYNMRDHLCENIEFIFGPPGTGKTTYLARNVLTPLMEENENCRVLVLTPTNKAADVLTQRIMEVSDDDKEYNEWLIRFGATADESIEQSPIFKDKSFDIRTLKRSITITTVARFPYDYFMPYGERLYLNDLKWDYIIIDEASMIPIANIVYPLYKKSPNKFIVAGDPFQIEPIASIDLWKNENIYTFVNLDSFTEPRTVPHQYHVETLTTQYRSIPSIGQLFSEFAYGGILQHYRQESSRKTVPVWEQLGIKSLNIIKFPVSKYESIYRPKRLQHSSSYHVYSALFTFEYVNYLAKYIGPSQDGSLFRIGIIAPYRAQADMIDKLFASRKLPAGVDVQVGTIHGFQGDECDAIFAVFNTPPKISTSKEMFLNKRNIINVSVSRARDYLFIVMPDDATENVDHLFLIKRIEELIKRTDSWKESSTSNLERSIFREEAYLENNAFSTSHQSINVYGLPEKRYEVRAEETAVDVQIHDGLR